jgi:ABC-type glycerol-3-phosphate transport system substrate-binding protein
MKLEKIPGPAGTALTRRHYLRGVVPVVAAGAAAAATFGVACGPVTSSDAPAASKSKAPATLEHLDWWGPTTPVLTTYFDGIKKEFEEKNPHLTINYAFVQGGTSAVREKWVVNTAGGTPHDSSQVSVAFIRDLMEGGMTEPLDPYIAKTPHMALSNFVDSGMFYNAHQGKHYGIPYDGPAMNVIGYNMQHFKEVGLDPSTKFTWSWTVEQFLDAANRLLKRDGGRTSRGSFAPPGLSVGNLLPWLYSHGGDFYSKDYTKTLVNDQKGRQALQFMVDLHHRHKFKSDVDGATFEGEGYSMSFTGSWTAGYLLDKNPGLQFGFAPLPKGPLGRTPSSQTWTNQWSMAKAGRNKDVSWEWLSFVNSQPVQEKYFAGVMKRVSGRKAFYQSAAWKAVVKEFPALDGIEKMEPMSKQYPWVKTTPINTETADIWRKTQAGELGVNDALTQVEQIVNRLLAGS